MANFTPYSYVALPRGQSPYVPINPALRGLGLRKPQMTPEQLEQVKKEAWLQQASGAVEPVSYADIVPSAVKDITGSDALALASGFFSPSSFIKGTKGAVSNLNKDQWIFRGTREPSVGNVSRRFNAPDYEFGTHVTIDPETARHFIKTNEYPTEFIQKMRSNVSKPLWVSDGDWTVDRLVPRIINENRDKLDARTVSKLEKTMRRYENKYRNSALGEEVTSTNNRYAKDVQQILKDAGFDHISYINIVEGLPVESAILFDVGAHSKALLTK